MLFRSVVVLGLLPPPTPKEQRHSGGVPDVVNDGDGGWLPLRVRVPALPQVAAGARLARRTSYTDSGKKFRSAARWTTDPRRRAFARDRREGGAVVVLDLSGSMSWEYEDVQRFLDVAPSATVLGYSSGLRSQQSQFNAWVLARDGKVVSAAEFERIFSDEVGGGNGCDGLALEWGAMERKRMGSRAPLVWITDGRVTNAAEHYNEVAVADAARRVVKYGYHVYRDADAALAAMRSPEIGRAHV